MDDQLPMMRAGTRLALLAAALALFAAACAANSDYMSSGGAGGRGMGGAGGGPACQVNIGIVGQQSDGGSLVAGPNATLRVHGTLSPVLGTSYNWRWTVTFADGSTVLASQVLDDVTTIDFPLASPGTYSVHADVTDAGTGERCSGESAITVPAVGANLATFRFRFVPARADIPAQEQEKSVTGGTPSRGGSIALSSGLPVPFAVQDTAKGALAAYIRIMDTDTKRVAVEAHTTATGAAINLSLVAGKYDMLVVPDGDVAPILMTNQSPAALQGMMPLKLATGVAINGRVTDGGSPAVPIVGARIALHAGPLPSTLATTDRDGRFTLHAAAGLFGATITQVGTQGVLEATLPGTAGVGIDTTVATPPALEVAIRPQPVNGQVGLHITGQQAASLATGAKVVFESAAAVPGTASVSVDGGTARPATMRFRSELAPQLDTGGTGNKGSVSIAGMPAARYRATVFPASADGPDAITATDIIDLSGGVAPTAAMEVALGRKVGLIGTLAPATETDGVVVTAVDIAGDFPIAIAAPPTTGGAFSLQVSAGRVYRLRAQPGPVQPLARGLFGPITVGATGTTLAPATMQGALLYGRTLTSDQMSGGVGDVLVQVFCLATSPGCTDLETPIAETVSRSDGYFQVMLPDPGVTP